MTRRHVCTHPRCKRRTILQSDFCSVHHPQAAEIFQNLRRQFSEDGRIDGLSMPGSSLVDLKCAGFAVIESDFHAADFTRCVFKNSSFIFSLFDHVTFNKIVFEDCKILESVFALSTFTNVKFVGCDIIQCNFNGGRFKKSSFEGCDMLYSRFIQIEFDELQFVDCNLKGVMCDRGVESRLTVKASNREDLVLI